MTEALSSLWLGIDTHTHTHTHKLDLILMKMNWLFELALNSQHNSSRFLCLLTERETLHSSQVFNQDQCSKLLWLLLFWVGLLSMCVYQCCSLLEGTGASDNPVCSLTHSALVSLIKCAYVCLMCVCVCALARSPSKYIRNLYWVLRKPGKEHEYQ